MSVTDRWANAMRAAFVASVAGSGLLLVAGCTHLWIAGYAGIALFLAGWGFGFFGSIAIGVVMMYRAVQRRRAAARERKPRERQRNSGITFSANSRSDVSSG